MVYITLEKSAIEVTGLAVNPSYRKQGLGGVLKWHPPCAAGFSWERTKVTLASEDSGTGRLTTWYKNMGFAQVGATRQGYPILEAAHSAACWLLERRPGRISARPVTCDSRAIQMMNQRSLEFKAARSGEYPDRVALEEEVHSN